MTKLVVDNKLPRLLSFKGSSLRWLPGKNDVDESVLAAMWKLDKTLQWYWEQGAFTFTKDGRPWEPSGAPPSKSAPPPALAGQPVATDSRHDRPPMPTPELTGGDAPHVAAPVRVGGGVPGSTAEAKDLVDRTTDVDKLNEWAIADNRKSVVRAIRSRLEGL